MEKTRLAETALELAENIRFAIEKILYTSSKIMGGETILEEEDKVAAAIKNTIEKISELFEICEPVLITVGLVASVGLLVRETRKLED